MKIIFGHSKRLGMVDKNYESQGQQSHSLHNNGRHVGFFRVIGYGHYFTEGLVFLSYFFHLNRSFTYEF